MLEEIYDKTCFSNALYDDAFLNECLDICCSFSCDSSKELYYYLISSEDADMTMIDLSKYEKFYVDMTNKWIYNILRKYSYDRPYNTRENRYSRFIKDTVRKFGYVRDIQDVQRLYSILASKSLGNSLDSFHFWRRKKGKLDAIGPKEFRNHFVHVSSSYVTYDEMDFDEIDYRIYINVANEDLFDFLEEYVKLCEQARLPYYFKFCTDRVRQDKVVIYTSAINLKSNINILRAAGDECPKIVSGAGSISKVSANVDGWFGIASEPLGSLSKQNYSFNSLRAKILEEAALKATLNYINSNFSQRVNLRGIEVDFKEIILDVSANIIKHEYGISNFDEEEFLKELFRSFIFLSNGGNYSFDIAVSSQKYIKCDLKIVQKIVKGILLMIRRIDSEFVGRYRQTIRNTCLMYDVDTDNFAFNDSSLEDFKLADRGRHFKF